jgi:hypothetical protein
MLSEKWHFCFNSEPTMEPEEYNSEVRHVFKDVFNAPNPNLPNVSKWEDSKRMRHIFGCAHIQTRKNKRMIFSIESMSPPIKANVSQNLADKWCTIMNECEEANKAIPCEKCIQGQNGNERLGCRRLYPRIREIFQNFSLDYDDLEQYQLVLDIDKPCPLCQ